LKHIYLSRLFHGRMACVLRSVLGAERIRLESAMECFPEQAASTSAKSVSG
jgi:hypothetical protein